MVLKSQEVPVFHPTLRDVSGSWEQYIQSIEKRCHVGICKIVPPKGWCASKKEGEPDLDLTIPRPIRQHVTGKRGLYRSLLVEQKSMPLREFRPQAVEDPSIPPATETPEEVERRFWRNVTLKPPLYGADVPGSLFDEDLKVCASAALSAHSSVYLWLPREFWVAALIFVAGNRDAIWRVQDACQHA
jgi:jumonji domain-containing protein 2